MESASAVSDAPSEARPRVLRASKKLCVRGGVLSLMSAVGGARSALSGARLLLVKKVLGTAGSAVIGAADNGSAILTAAGMGDAAGSAVAMIVLAFVEGAGVVFEESFAVEVEADVAESGAETEAEGGVRPSLTRAMAAVVNPKDDPKKANKMAAMASLNSLPLT